MTSFFERLARGVEAVRQTVGGDEIAHTNEFDLTHSGAFPVARLNGFRVTRLNGFPVTRLNAMKRLVLSFLLAYRVS